ncbi:10712_t:CDS:10 [Diversispora eburnea]|uniref:10712_t:CDS:1 n=1 Tax=Diversispora eburnea TaxID=1213867 RepID=A0A9N8YI08_9GLOM|nr:10712_t:CDS:10 [Diversispora eburnea]
MDFERLIENYCNSLNSKILSIYQTKRANRSKENNENENKTFKVSSNNNFYEPEIEPMSWSWVCARVADMLTHNPHGLTECVMLNKLLSEWQDISVEYRKGIPKTFSPFRTILPRYNTKIRDYELIKDRRVRFNRASLSKTAPKLTFLNTGNIIIVLTSNDEEFINNLFTDSFLDVTSDDIRPKESANLIGFSDKVCVYVRDMLSTRCATLILLDDKIQMTNLFKMGDFLGIHWPYVESGLETQDGMIIHYSDLTVFFCLPMSELCKEDNSKKIKGEHMIDYKFHHERFFMNQLPSRGLNVTLYGKLERISENVGYVSITLWGKIGREVTEFQVGQYIVLEGLRTWKNFDDNLDINVSTAKGWLAISSLRNCTIPLNTITKYASNTYLDQFVCRCLINDWKINEELNIIKWYLDDGTGAIWVDAISNVSQDILNSIGDALNGFSGHLGSNIKGKMLWYYSDSSRSLAQADCHRMLIELQN